MKYLFSLIIVLIIAIVVREGITEEIQNVKEGFSTDLVSIMGSATSGNTINTDSFVSMMPNTSGAVVETVDEGLSIVQTLLTFLLFGLLIGIVIFIYFKISDNPYTQKK